MSTPPPPQNNGNSNDAGPPGPTREDLIRDWIGKRLLANATMQSQLPSHAGMNGAMAMGIPQTNTAIPQMAFQGIAMAQPLPVPDLMNNPYHAYIRDQQLGSFYPPQANVGIHNNMNTLRAAEIVRQAMQLQAQSRSLQGQSTSPTLPRGTLAQAHAQLPTQGQSLNNLNTTGGATTNGGTGQRPPSESLATTLNEMIASRMPDASHRKSLQEELKNKITEKIREKLKRLKPDISEVDQNAVMAQLLPQSEPRLMQQNQQLQQQAIYLEQRQMIERELQLRLNGIAADRSGIGFANGQEVLNSMQRVVPPAAHLQDNGETKSITETSETMGTSIARRNESAKIILNNIMKKQKAPNRLSNTAPVARINNTADVEIAVPVARLNNTAAAEIEVPVARQNLTAAAEIAPAAIDLICGECDKAPTTLKPPKKRRKVAATQQAEQPPAQTTQPIPLTQLISNKLDDIIDSLDDENVRSALQEDRDNDRTRRKEIQQNYEDQIKDMESRLSMYTKLEGLAEEIAEIRSESNNNTANGTNRKMSSNAEARIDGAMDMIHMGLNNYRMLEDNSDRLLGIDEKKK